MRITKQVAKTIADNVIKASTKQADYDAIKAEVQKVAREQLVAKLDQVHPEFRKKTKGLPAEWFGQTTSVTFSSWSTTDPNEVKLKYIMDGYYLSLDQPIPCPVTFGSNRVQLPLDLLAKAAAVYDRHQAALENINTTLAAYTTTEKLLKAVPELAPYVPSGQLPGANLPAVVSTGLLESLQAAGVKLGEQA